MANFDDVPDDFGTFGGGPAASTAPQAQKYVHPLAVFFTIAFKVAALVVYLVLTLVPGFSGAVSAKKRARLFAEGRRRACRTRTRQRCLVQRGGLLVASFGVFFLGVFLELTARFARPTCSSSCL